MTQGHMPRNYMLEFVDEVLPGYISSHSGELGKFADSPEFILRLKAATLNLLPAKYVTTSTGMIYSAYGMKEHQMEADVVSAFLRASVTSISNLNSIYCFPGFLLLFVTVCLLLLPQSFFLLKKYSK